MVCDSCSPNGETSGAYSGNTKWLIRLRSIPVGRSAQREGGRSYAGHVRPSAQREGGSWRDAHHLDCRAGPAAGLAGERDQLLENLVAARFPKRAALVVHPEQLCLAQRAEQVEVGMRGQEPV